MAVWWQYAIFYFARLYLSVIVGALVLLLVPGRFVERIPVLGWVKGKLSASFWHIVSLSAKGPVFRAFIWCGRRWGRGKFYSTCRAPLKLKLTSTSYKEVAVQWQPNLPPVNACHEESYVCAWRLEEDPPDKWREKVLMADDNEFIAEANAAKMDKKKAELASTGRPGSRFKAVLGKLPTGDPITVRVCAVNRNGRGPYCAEKQVSVLTVPDKQGGFIGPLGPAAGLTGKEQFYRWAQSKHEVNFTIQIPRAWTSKDLRVKVLVNLLEIVYVGDKKDVKDAGPDGVLLAGNMPCKVKPDLLVWTIEPGPDEDTRLISVTLHKEELMEKWPALIEHADHPRIDVELLKLAAEGNVWHELQTKDLWE